MLEKAKKWLKEYFAKANSDLNDALYEHPFWTTNMVCATGFFWFLVVFCKLKKSHIEFIKN